MISSVNLGPIKIVFRVMSGTKQVWHWSSFFLSFIHSFSPEWGNLMCVWLCMFLCRCDVTTVIDWQSLLSMSQLPVVMSNKTTALRRPTLHWDLFTHSYSFFSFWKLEDFLSESLLFGFQDEIITSTLWLMRYSDPFFIFFSVHLVSQCVCLCMQIIVNVDVKKKLLKTSNQSSV